MARSRPRWWAWPVALAAMATLGATVGVPAAAADVPVGDPDFGLDGRLPVDQGAVHDRDGRLITVRLLSDGGGQRVRLDRYTSAGQPDPTWVPGDVALGSAPGQPEVVVDHLDRVVLATHEASAVVVRRVVDGVLDPSFADGGATSVTTDPDTPRATGVRVDAQGRIVLVITGPTSTSVVRLGTDGRPDATFASGGTATIPCCGAAPQHTELLGFALQPQGSTVVVLRQAGRASAVVVSSTGVLQASMDLTSGLPGGTTEVAGAVVDPQGRVVYWGAQRRSTTLVEPVLRRLGPDLVPDAAFGGDGRPPFDGWVRGVAPRPGGVVVATSFDELYALTDDGYLDPSFGVGGRSERTVGVRRSNPFVRDSLEVLTNPDGGVVLVENTGINTVGELPIPYSTEFRLAQVTADGAWSEAQFWYADGRVDVLSELSRAVIEADGSAVLPVVTGYSASPSGRIRLLLRAGLAVAAPPLAPFPSPGPMVDRLYADLLWRAPTAGERAASASAISAGEHTPAGQVLHLVRHGERSAVVDPVVRLYRAFFLRPADTSGLRHWVAVRRGGATVASVATRFAQSPEFVRTYGRLSNRAFVELVYRNVFGRAGDAAGVAYWTHRLDKGRSNRGGVMAALSESSEHRRRTAAEVLTTSIIYGLLGRAPTIAELVAWAPTAALDAEPLVAAVLAGEAWRVRVG